MNRRADDNEDTVRSRLQAYHNQTAPLAEWYSNKGILLRVNGDQQIEDVASEIISGIGG